jgi:peptide/nickel transport system ATP-binding protein
VLSVEGLEVAFRGRDTSTRVVRGLDLSVAAGERVALVGESGSGKSMTARAIMGLLPPAARASGRVRFDGADLFAEGRDGLLGSRMTMVFQDPMSALNPVFRVEDQLLAIARNPDRGRLAALLESVAIQDPGRVLRSYPFQLSGGMAQRVLLAAALVNGPDLVIADEPATALDADIQQRSLELLARRSREDGMAVLLITHHLGLVRNFAERVHVMRDGEIVEHGATREILRAPSHEYTRALLASVPRLSHASDA